MKKKKIVKRVKAVHKKRRIKPEAGKISGKAIIGIAVVVVLIAGGAFFFTKGNTGISSPLNGLIKAPLNPNCELKDPELCKFINNWQVQQNYTITSNSKDKDGTTSESVFEISGETKSHMVARQAGKDSFEMINIDKTTYTKDYTDNKWWKHTYEPDKDISKDIVDTDKFNEKEAVEDKTEYKSLGKEACGDLQCFKYQIINPDDTSTTEYIWFDDKDYLLRKQSSTDSEGNVTESTFAYNPISISEPSPVKEGSPEAMYGLPEMSAEEKAQFEQLKNDSEEAQKALYGAPQDNSQAAPEESDYGY